MEYWHHGAPGASLLLRGRPTGRLYPGPAHVVRAAVRDQQDGEGTRAATRHPLLERSAHGIGLTTEGRELYATCERVFTELATFERARASPRDLRGDLFVATSDHVARHLLGRPLATLRDAHPELVPRVLTGPAHLLVPSIAERRVPFGLFFKVPASRTLSVTPLATFPCQIVVAPSRRKDPSVLARFIGSRELDDPLNRSFPTVRYLRSRGLATEIRLSTNDLGAHVAWVREGLGVSILPRFVVERELDAGELVILFPRYKFDARLDLVARKGEPLGAEASALVEALRSALRMRSGCRLLGG